MVNDLLLNNKKMKYFKYGNGKKIIIMIPGLSIKSVMEYESSIINDYNLFINDYTIYCFDRLENPDTSYDIESMCDYIYLAIKELKLSDVYLYGASEGGMISMMLAIKYPSIYKKIAVVSTSANVTKENYKSINRWIDLAKDNKKEELMLEFMEKIYPKKLYLKSIDLCKSIANTITKEELDRFIINASAIKDFNILDRLVLIKKPFLMVGGKLDNLLGINPIIEAKMHNKDIKTYIFEGYGHALYDLAPDFKKILLNFFNEKE